ncbi:MAG TPA: FGGY family carbohydrate kinase [Solirubrobacteraceae bacterium]|nr:FGGY family carbohydrate kinase [Solirubrobacteraceae bacterium]
MNVLAIDQGTSATKAIVVDERGTVLGRSSVRVHPRAGAAGEVLQDAQELLESVLSAGRAALRDAGVRVDAVGLGNQGETVVAWDRADGRPLAPALSWQDRQSAGLVARLRDHAPRLREISGLPLDPYFAAPKMALLAQRHPAAAVTTVDSWLLARLTGRLATDAATASRTMLLDLGSCAWSAEACEVFGIDVGGLPEIVDCAQPVGRTRAFGQPLEICALCVDQQAALFAQGCLKRGEAKCTYGTGAFLLVNAGGDPPRAHAAADAPGLSASVAWRLGGEPSYCLDGQVYTAGAAVSWLEGLGLISGPGDLDRCWDGGGGVTFVPALAGLGAPFWAPDARAGWLDLSLQSGREALVSAVVEGVAAQVAWLARAAADAIGGALGTLRVDGGLTASRALMQAQADLLQAPVAVHSGADATALGLAALARLGAGDAPDPGRAVGQPRPSAVYEPRMPGDEAERRLLRWREAAGMLARRAR